MSGKTQKYFYMEDFSVGQKLTAGPGTITAEEIIHYAKKSPRRIFVPRKK